MLFRVVKCFKCNFYQVDSVKKAQKWQCKMCGENQTLQTEYSRGSAKDCRLQVQKLNIANAENAAQRYQFAEKVLSGEIHLPETAEDKEESEHFPGSSKWTDLIDQQNDAKAEESEDTNTESKPEKSGKKPYENHEESMKKKFQREFLSANTFKETDFNNKVYPKKLSNESNPPSWKEFYGRKRESAKERREFEEKSRKFFSPSYSTYQDGSGRSMPLPKLLDYTEMQKRGRQKKIQRNPREESSDFLGSNETGQAKPELQPVAKRYKVEESFVKNPMGKTSSSVWASFCDSDDEK